MSKHDIEDEGLSNPSGNPVFETILNARLNRRQLMRGGLGSLALSLFSMTGLSGVAQAASLTAPEAKPGFKPIPPSFADKVNVAEGYSAHVFVRWGDPIGDTLGNPAFYANASNSAEDQLIQFGMHHDGMSYLPLPWGSNSSTSGLIAVNHEYIDRGLLHPTEPSFSHTPAQVQKEINAHGVTVYEVSQTPNRQWHVKRPSKYARRITADTPCRIGGPAKGHELMRTQFDPKGEEILGTLNNCANGLTPWGTYLTCEENFNGYFTNYSDDITPDQKRYGVTMKGAGYEWTKAGGIHTRFDCGLHPNEPNRFGWIVEIDPYDVTSPPVKRTALGRFKHENAAVTLAADNRVVVYMGDDERFEYIYKFVSDARFDGSDRKKNLDLLDKGTLYVAQFNEDGNGNWLPLTPNNPKLTAFKDQAEILIKARSAADAAGATQMDRPEWIAIHPVTRQVYCTLTNNSKRDKADAANPRIKNTHGHIVRWEESDAAADTFRWDIFAMAGDPASGVEANRGSLKGDLYSAPDGLAFDQRGMLWIETDVSTSAMYHPELANKQTEFKHFGNNQLLAVSPSDGIAKRFLTGPVGCEITGFTMTPDSKTLFINIQHPGEPLDDKTEFNDPRQPSRYSAWPDGGRPRSATLVITKDDGGVIGT
ncbi:PhoX family phosphatase [Chitinivorax sp. B]|uniref:PhoX family protein n=1 Tax=Chitinivorax sp. B TaxID=2502235 RepID=UPI0010F53519|nr:PhoX family phosphatase [Chitinivorax sp. B]